MLNNFRISLIVFLMSPLITIAGFSVFNDSRFLTDPFRPFHNYSDDEKSTYKEDLEIISKRFGKLTKTQSNKDVQSLIDQVYDGLKDQYPKFMSNKDKPTIAIVENNDFTSLTAFGSRLVAPHGILVIPNGFINSQKDRCAKMGLIAHEMSHLFLHHSQANVESPIIQVRYANGQKMTEKETQAALQYVQLARHIGDLRYTEANGMQLSSPSGTWFEDFILTLYQENKKGCGTPLKKDLKSLAKNIRSRNSEFHGELQFETSESLASLNTTTKKMIQLIDKCTETLGPEKNAIDLGVSYKDTLIRAGITDPLLDSKATAPTFAEYIALNKKIVAKMKTLSSQFNLDQLRTVTAEDQADEMAVGLLMHLNCSPEKYIDLFKEEIPNSKQKCEGQIKEGKEPPFGDLSDPHHSFCWRYDYFKKYSEGSKQAIDGLGAKSLVPVKVSPSAGVK